VSRCPRLRPLSHHKLGRHSVESQAVTSGESVKAVQAQEDQEEWDRRVMALASARIAAERSRLERLGIIDANGDLVSRQLPPDMQPESDTTVETG